MPEIEVCIPDHIDNIFQDFSINNNAFYKSTMDDKLDIKKYIPHDSECLYNACKNKSYDTSDFL